MVAEAVETLKHFDVVRCGPRLPPFLGSPVVAGPGSYPSLCPHVAVRADRCRPEQSESPETRSPQQQQLLQQQAEADDADPDSKLTQESGFFAGNPRYGDDLLRACSP